MKLFVITSRIPYPLDKGDKLRIYHQLKELSKHHKIYLCAIKSPLSKEHKISREVLNEFCEEIVDIFQNEKIEMINVHLLRHLVYQTRRFGPLFIFSAMSFESANRLMRSTATGTHSFCSLICRRYVQRQRLLTEVIESDTLEELAKQLTDQERFSNEKKKFERITLDANIVESARSSSRCCVFVKNNIQRSVFRLCLIQTLSFWTQ